MIDVLKRITEMREARRWTEYQLAEKSGLTQSTISSWYRKGMLPTIPSLLKICNAFEISMSQFFIEDNSQTITLSDRQRTLLSAAEKLNKNQYNALLHFIETLWDFANFFARKTRCYFLAKWKWHTFLLFSLLKPPIFEKNIKTILITIANFLHLKNWQFYISIVFILFIKHYYNL